MEALDTTATEQELKDLQARQKELENYMQIMRLAKEFKPTTIEHAWHRLLSHALLMNEYDPAEGQMKRLVCWLWAHAQHAAAAAADTKLQK